VLGLALTQEEPCLSDEVNEKFYRAVDLRPLLETPHDYLGDYVSQGKANGWNPTGFHPTPHPVVELMARLNLHEVQQEGRDLGAAKVCEPCAGSGRTLLHASNLTLHLSGQEIDPLAVATCKISGALYAPWLSFSQPPCILCTVVPFEEDKDTKD
jgi:type I restriction-modification system DNA methylase subunit